MPRIRTIKAAVDYFKEQDPNTCITEYFLRTEARSGRLPGVVMAGAKYLINLDSVEEYLAHKNTDATNKKDDTKLLNYGKLRRIEG